MQCTLCGSCESNLVETIRRKPPRETDFGIAPDNYVREIRQCDDCSVYFSQHDLLNDEFYREQYNKVTYQRSLVESFDRIRSLPESASDNKQRTRRVNTFHANRGKNPASSVVLDIGTGLCVFLAEMKDLGFQCHAIDPDSIAVEHAQACAGVDESFAGTLETFPPRDAHYDIITFNKVLEHVPNPTEVLASAVPYLDEDGFLYLELPDGRNALENGTVYDREEFYIEHETVFTEESVQWLVHRAGLRVMELQSIHEPSDKYTIIAFCQLTET